MFLEPLTIHFRLGPLFNEKEVDQNFNFEEKAKSLKWPKEQLLQF